MISKEAAARLFLARQGLSRPFAERLGAGSLARFVSAVGGLQLDSINVVARAHELTLWSRFGPYDRAELDRLAYRDRRLFEYWAHAACLIAAEDLPAWARVMADYNRIYSGGSDWMRTNARTLRTVADTLRKRGPLSQAAFERPAAQGKAAGWWDWKPAQKALNLLWMTGKIGVHSRRHFQKHYDVADRVLPDTEPLARAEFPRWHLRKTLGALGAASEADLPRYLTFPWMARGERSKALKDLLKSGEVVPIEVEGQRGRWYCLAEDVRALASPPEPRGTTLLSPFDSFLWHRGRIKALFGFDYSIEVYVPASKRKFGYYSMPILHDGRLIGRLDPKNHRAEKRLEARNVHFEGKPTPAGLAGTAAALRSLAAFLGSESVDAGPGPLRSEFARVDR